MNLQLVDGSQWQLPICSKYDTSLSIQCLLMVAFATHNCIGGLNFPIHWKVLLADDSPNLDRVVSFLKGTHLLEATGGVFLGVIFYEWAFMLLNLVVL